MKKALYTLTVVTLFFSCSKEKSALSVVPLNADGIAVINIKAIGTDLLHGETSLDNIQKLLIGIQFGESNEFKKFIKNIPKLPISIFSKGAVFTYSKEEQRVLGISIPLMSEALSTIKTIGKQTVLKNKGTSYILFDVTESNKGIALIEKDYILLLKSTLETEQLLHEAIDLNKLQKSESIVSKNTENHDCYIFAQSNGIAIDGTLDFEGGKIEIDLHTDFDGENPLDSLLNTPLDFTYDTSSIVEIQSNINPNLLNSIPLLPQVIKDVLDTTDVFYGPISLTLQGVELRSRHFISYKEDEEFNLIEKTIIKIDTVNKIHGHIEGNTQLFSPFLEYFISLNILKKEKANWYSSPVLLDQYQIYPESDKVYFTSYEHDFTNHSHQKKGLAHLYINLEKIHTLEKNSHFWEGYTIEIDPIKHFYVNQRIKSFDILLPNTSNIKIDISFKDKDENALIECIHILKRISDLKKKIHLHN